MTLALMFGTARLPLSCGLWYIPYPGLILVNDAVLYSLDVGDESPLRRERACMSQGCVAHVSSPSEQLQHAVVCSTRVYGHALMRHSENIPLSP